MSSSLKTFYDKRALIAPLHTGGPIAVSTDGSKLVTCVGQEAILTDVERGTELCRFTGDTESISSLCVSPCSTFLLVFTGSLALRIFRIPTTFEPSSSSARVQPERVIARAHDAPIHVSRVDPTSTYLASGSADGVVKVWDIRKGYVTHMFKGHGGVVSALAFRYPRDASSVAAGVRMQLVTGSVDTKIRVFELSHDGASVRSRPEAVLDGHVSVPRGLDVSLDGKWLLSGGRDSVVLVWELASGQSEGKAKGKGKDRAISPRLLKTIPVLERVEAVGLLHPDEDIASSSASDGVAGLRFYVAGEKGVVSVWNCQKASPLFHLGKERSGDEEESRQILDALYIPSISTIVSLHGDQNVLFHSLTKRTLRRQFIGFNDEIVDVAFINFGNTQNDSHLAVATNSSLIRIYDTSTLDARLLEGHSEIVLCLDRSVDGRLLASGSKDSSARLWAPSGTTADSWGWGWVAICDGHAESVGAIALSRQDNDSGRARFMFTGSQDRTIKMWDLSNVPTVCERDGDEEVLKCKSICTLKAHDKDINSLDVAPNNRLLASGSQDRTAKVYEIDYSSNPVRGSLKVIGTCVGHKRGVWCVRFGKHEKVLATASGDKSVKLWSLSDFNCLKTFEGHGNSVLRVDFLSEGLQMVSCGSDGLVKVWNVRTEECAVTMDNHEDKVWALAVGQDEKTIVSGAADSVITFWKDCTEEKAIEKERKKAETVSKEQDFMNYVSLRDYRNAILLALAMEQPGRLLSVFKSVRDGDGSEQPLKPFTGHPAVDEVIRTLSPDDLAKLIRFLKDWNSSGKTSEIAQGILFAIVKLRTAEEFIDAFKPQLGVAAVVGNGGGLKEIVDGLIPYTARHLTRMERLVQESYVVDFLLEEMNNGMLDEDLDVMDVEI